MKLVLLLIALASTASAKVCSGRDAKLSKRGAFIGCAGLNNYGVIATKAACSAAAKTVKAKWVLGSGTHCIKRKDKKGKTIVTMGSSSSRGGTAAYRVCMSCSCDSGPSRLPGQCPKKAHPTPPPVEPPTYAPGLVECMAGNSEVEDHLRCRDGSLETTLTSAGGAWAACENKGSKRMQCPPGRKPCNNKGAGGVSHFSCQTDCKDYGGDANCQLFDCHALDYATHACEAAGTCKRDCDAQAGCYYNNKASKNRKRYDKKARKWAIKQRPPMTTPRPGSIAAVQGGGDNICRVYTGCDVNVKKSDCELDNKNQYKTRGGCIWVGRKCESQRPLECKDHTKREICGEKGCFYDKANKVCKDAAPACDAYDFKRMICEKANCHYVKKGVDQGKCMAARPPVTCSDFNGYGSKPCLENNCYYDKVNSTCDSVGPACADYVRGGKCDGDVNCTWIINRCADVGAVASCSEFTSRNKCNKYQGVRCVWDNKNLVCGADTVP